MQRQTLANTSVECSVAKDQIGVDEVNFSQTHDVVRSIELLGGSIKEKGYGYFDNQNLPQ